MSLNNMLKTRIITDRKEIDQILPQCIKLARDTGAVLPFQYIHLPLLWWDHFNSKDGTLFTKKRGTNFLGAQSRLEKFYLLITENDEGIYGAVPFVSYSVKIPKKKQDLRILTFAGDYQLMSYQDFLVAPAIRRKALSSIFKCLVDLIKRDHDLLFLQYLPETSQNIPIVRELAAGLQNTGLSVCEKITARRGGVWPWTLEPLISFCKKLHEKIRKKETVYSELGSFIEKLSNCSSFKLLFPATRDSLETDMQNILKQLNNDDLLEPETGVIYGLLDHARIIYPFINLPPDHESYMMTLSKSTRRYFRRYKRRFEKQGGFFEKITSLELTQRDVDDYLNLHEMRWGKESASLSSDVAVNFHKDLSKILAKHGQFTLFFACFRNKRIASHSCIDINLHREGYITGRDAKYDELRASRLLYMETIYDAIDSGFATYDLGLGWFAYKMNFTKTFSTTRNFIISGNKDLPELNKIFLGYEYMGLDDDASPISCRDHG